MTDDINKIIGTIRSRCQHIFFPKLSNILIIDYLMKQGCEKSLATEIASISQGRLIFAKNLWEDNDFFEEYKETMNELFTFFITISAKIKKY